MRYDMRFDENIGVGEITGVSGCLAEGRDAPLDGVAPPPPTLVNASDRSRSSALLSCCMRGIGPLMAGRMAVVIPHRFSSVRMPDRMVVLGEGRVLREGWPTTRLRRAPSRSGRR